jgi:hypothetical protein
MDYNCLGGLDGKGLALATSIQEMTRYKARCLALHAPLPPALAPSGPSLLTAARSRCGTVVAAGGGGEPHAAAGCDGPSGYHGGDRPARPVEPALVPSRTQVFRRHGKDGGGALPRVYPPRLDHPSAAHLCAPVWHGQARVCGRDARAVRSGARRPAAAPARLYGQGTSPHSAACGAWERRGVGGGGALRLTCLENRR